MNQAKTSLVKETKIAKLLRQIIVGEVLLKLTNPARTWIGAYGGDVEFFAGDWRIVFFNDCNELDYVDNVTSPDGMIAEFSDWAKNPLALLTGKERAALQRILEKAA
jgi:hypothetical protein